MDHLRCSELLLPFVREELEKDEREQVRAHLDSCSECREEHQALEALLAVEVEPMSGAERESMHAAVAKGLETREDAVAEEPARRVELGWFRRSLPALGALALTIIGVVLAANLFTGAGTESAMESGGTDSGGASGDSADEAEAPGAEAVAPESDKVDDALGQAKQPVPFFEPGKRDLDRKALTALSRKAGFESALGFSDAKAERLLKDYTLALQAQAPPDTKKQVRECVETVAVSQETVLPTFGTQGRYEGKDALLLGFVSKNNAGVLNRYMLWLWPKGSCDVPLDYLSGPIKE